MACDSYSTQLTTEQYTTLLGIDCGLLTDPENGEVSFSSTIYNSVATYICDSGYALIGDNMRTCLDTGLWSGSAPTCGKYKQLRTTIMGVIPSI